MKKALGILAALAVLVCGMTGAMAEPFRVGICQLVTHDALDAATQGFMDALTEELGADNVTFDVQNAAGDSNTCSTIVNSFVADGVDLILANATARPAGGRRRNRRHSHPGHLRHRIRRGAGH